MFDEVSSVLIMLHRDLTGFISGEEVNMMMLFDHVRNMYRAPRQITCIHVSSMPAFSPKHQ